MLATLKEVLEIANQRETAIPHFNIDNIDGIEAVMEAADTENYPVILSIGQGAINAGNLWYLADAVQRAANDSKVPVVLHLDHGVSYEQTVVCLRAGFTSVMYDGSHHPFEENVRESLAVIRSAHAVGVSVECELGAIGGVEDGMSHDHLNLVDVGEVERFCAQVDCDALAIGIGNAHGLYKGTPHFDFDRLTACRKLDTPPLCSTAVPALPTRCSARRSNWVSAKSMLPLSCGWPIWRAWRPVWASVISIKCASRPRTTLLLWPARRSGCFRDCNRKTFPFFCSLHKI